MSDEIKVSRPAAVQPRADYHQPVAAPGEVSAAEPRSSKMPWIVLAVVVVILVIGGFVFRSQLFGGGKSAQTAGSQPSGYQAVFLTNGQVYFGKISSQEGDYITLNDIFYLQVGPQQGSGAATNTPQSISLVKLGNELHGPVDQMHISKTQVLFYEDLKASGQVVQAIQQYKASQSAPSSQNNAANQGAAAQQQQMPAQQQQAPAQQQQIPAQQQQIPAPAPTK